MRLVLAPLVIAAAASCACSPVPDDTGGGHVLGEAGAPPAPDLERGELLSFACQACHSLGEGGEHQVGPNLHGIFGSGAASQPGFAYSDALRETNLVWTPEALDAWLADPAGYVPGTTMTFTGYRSERDRRDLIAFLVEATAVR